MSGHDLVLYASWLVSTGRLKAADSLAQYISCVSVLHKKVGLACPVPSEYGPLKNLIDGVRRLAERPARQSRPVTPTILRNLLRTTPSPSACATQLTKLRIFKAFSLILFMSMLRSSNLVPESRSNIDWDAILVWGRVRLASNGCIIRVEKSKTIQHRQRTHTIPLAECSDSEFCPVRTLNDLMMLYGRETCTNNTPVFRLPSSSGTWVPMTKGDYVPFFKFRLKQMNLNPDNYGLHGFRHGGVQQCLLAEPNLGLVQVASDHRSDAILVYANVPPERRMYMSARVSASLMDN